MADDALLTASQLRAWYGAAQILYDVDLQVRRGEVVALMGRNGAGKSTTLKTIMGMVPRRQGSVRFMGHDLSRAEPHDCARLGLGFVPEDRRVFTDLTVMENLEVGRQAARRWPDGSAAPQWAPGALFTLFPNLGEMPDRPCSELAYGDVKRVELAIAMANGPRLLLMDEPTAGMAPAERNALMALTKRLVTERGMAVLFTEHSMDVVFAYADRMIVLARGRLIAAGKPLEIREDPKVQEVYFGSGKTFEKKEPA